jgi:4-hydroxythreonine-4-phosphate dehydrogenase
MTGKMDMKPILMVTMGDPAGIGPEILLKALSSESVYASSRCIAVGSMKVLRLVLPVAGLGESALHSIKNPEDAVFDKGLINVIDLDNVDMSKFEFGKISGMCGRAAYEYIERSIALTHAGRAHAVVTAPINKESLRASGVKQIGHTEIFGDLLGVKNPLTMFEVENLRVFFLSRHLSLRKAIDYVTKEHIVDCLQKSAEMLRLLGLPGGHIAVAGLNPHCGEHGLFGDEEMTDIVPAVEEMQKRGYAVTGPIGADSVFDQARQGRFDAVLSLYHDQGHIATKTYNFGKTISLTLGLPFLRTSVDHGTAFDIAGKGIASDVSMAEAILVAVKYALNYSKNCEMPPPLD